MKYTNCQKYMNGFERAPRKRDLSLSRLRTLCDALGRVQLGARYICLPSTGAAHTATLLLEAVIKQAGHRVGRISSLYGFDHLHAAMLNGDLPHIELYCKAVTELKAAVQKTEQTYFAEEAVVALGLLLCKLDGSDVIVLEGLSDQELSLDAVCAPYDLIVMPGVYESRDAEELIKPLCAAIRRGTREVVSGNQRSEIYNDISAACVMDGVRLFLPVKAKTQILERLPRKLVFQYADKEPCTLQSPSYLLADAALTVMESAFSLRRGGLKLPWSAIASAFEGLHETGCFEVLSVSPDVILDIANTPEEASLLCKTVKEVCGDREAAICVALHDPDRLPALLSSFYNMKVTSLILYQLKEAPLPALPDFSEPCEIFVYSDPVKAATQALSKAENTGMLLCFGDFMGLSGLKNAIKQQWR